MKQQRWRQTFVLVCGLVALLWSNLGFVQAANFDYTIFAQLNVPVGIATDLDGNVYIDSAPSLSSSIITRFASNSNPGKQIVTDSSSPGRLAFDSKSNQIWSAHGNLINTYDGQMGERIDTLRLSQIPIDATDVFNVEAGYIDSSYRGGSDFTSILQPNSAEYGDFALYRQGDQLDMFISGISRSMNAFVLRVRFVDGTFSAAKVIVASSSTTGAGGNLSEPHGIAVSPSGVVLTTLTLAYSRTSTGLNYDRAFAFSATFPESGSSPKPLFDGEFGDRPSTVTSRGMTSDATGNFYVVGSEDSSALCMRKNKPVPLTRIPMLVIGADLQTLLACLPATTTPEDVAVDATNTVAYITNQTSASGEVQRYSLTSSPTMTTIGSDGGDIVTGANAFRLVVPIAALYEPTIIKTSIPLVPSLPIPPDDLLLRLFRLEFNPSTNIKHKRRAAATQPIVLQKPATLIATYTGEELQLYGLQPKQLALLKRDGDKWVTVPVTVDPTEHTVTAQITEPSEYALIGIGNTQQNPSGPTNTRQKPRPIKLARVTLAQHATPNISVQAGSIITYMLEATNRGEGSAKDTTISMPFDATKLTLIDVKMSRSDAWVAKVMTDTLKLHTGRLSSENDVVTATVRFAVSPDVPAATEIRNELTYAWRDSGGGGTGRSNTVTLTIATEAVEATLRLTVDPANGPVGTKHTFSSDSFAPKELVALWYNKPDSTLKKVKTVQADDHGAIQITLVTDGIPPGTYTMVAQGNESQVIATGDFVVTP